MIWFLQCPFGTASARQAKRKPAVHEYSQIVVVLLRFANDLARMQTTGILPCLPTFSAPPNENAALATGLSSHTSPQNQPHRFQFLPVSSSKAQYHPVTSLCLLCRCSCSDHHCADGVSSLNRRVSSSVTGQEALSNKDRTPTQTAK